VKPLEACQVLLGVSLEPDIVEYLEGTASGLRSDIADGASEADEAAEELLGLLGPVSGLLLLPSGDLIPLLARSPCLLTMFALVIVLQMLGEAGADDDVLEAQEADLRRYCVQMISPPAQEKAPAQKKPPPARKTLREMHAKVEGWRVAGVGETKFAMDQVGALHFPLSCAKQRYSQSGGTLLCAVLLPEACA
jgi:hypothetical protein